MLFTPAGLADVCLLDVAILAEVIDFIWKIEFNRNAGTISVGV